MHAKSGGFISESFLVNYFFKFISGPLRSIFSTFTRKWFLSMYDIRNTLNKYLQTLIKKSRQTWFCECNKIHGIPVSAATIYLYSHILQYLCRVCFFSTPKTHTFAREYISIFIISLIKYICESSWWRKQAIARSILLYFYLLPSCISSSSSNISGPGIVDSCGEKKSNLKKKFPTNVFAWYLAFKCVQLDIGSSFASWKNSICPKGFWCFVGFFVIVAALLEKLKKLLIFQRNC